MAEAVDPVPDPARILAEHGPLHEDEIAQRLRDGGVAEPDNVLKQIRYEIEYPTRQLVDERWVWLPTLLAGRVFTHRVNADEVAHELLTVNPDLSPITALCDHTEYQQLVDGTSVQTVLVDYDDELLEQRGIPPEVVDPLGALLLAPGALGALGVDDGDLVGVRLTEQGLAVERVTAVADTKVGTLLAATLEADEPAYFDAAVWTVCTQDPTAFTEPSPPVSEIVDDCGLTHHDEWLAPGGFDWDRWDFERGCTVLANRHDIDRDDAVALYTLVKLYERVSLLIESADVGDAPEDASTEDHEHGGQPEVDESAALLGELGAALADPILAGLLVDETIGDGPGGAATLGAFADMMEPQVPRMARVAFRWLRAVALERIGDIEEAEREFLAAESMDPDWPLPLLDLARFASDRGDATRGLALLRRAGAGTDHPLLELLERCQVEPRRDLGRNEQCWCGSGRKYKKCHLGQERLPLGERAAWLYAKAVQHALLNGWSDLLFEVGYERCRHVGDDPDAVDAALSDPLVLDAVLFEGGAFEEFLELRGSLLPDDERLLAAQWLLVERSVFDVEQVQPGEGVTVRDVRTGEMHRVRERAASRQLQPGQLVCARVLPAGVTGQFFGGVEPVALHERDPLIHLLDSEPDAVTLVAQLSRRFAPPALTNTEGDPLAFCEATVRFGDHTGIEVALDALYDRVDDDEPARWHEHVSTRGMQRIRATLILDGDTLQAETNSEERMDRVLATLKRVDPTMTVIDDSRTPVRDADEAVELAEQSPSSNGSVLDPDDPEIAAVLNEFIRDYEANWLDTSIPALDGRTPRQAADDPTRRGDLIKLLDSFPAGAAGRGGMDADRLRAALGLR